MENGDGKVQFEEVLDKEIDDIWDIFFPYMKEKKEWKRSPDGKQGMEPTGQPVLKRAIY